MSEQMGIQPVETTGMVAVATSCIVQQVVAIQSVMNSVMKDGTHYGTIPNCGDKPTLLKPGAEKLCMMFRLAPSYKIDRADFDGAHREYEVVCTLTSMETGQVISQGVGSCSTMESKYRYRKDWDHKVGNKPGRMENPDIADTYNTVMKMAKKRAMVDATLSATAASDIFTQDIEDFKGENGLIDATPSASVNTKQQAQHQPSSAPAPTPIAETQQLTPLQHLKVVLRRYAADTGSSFADVMVGVGNRHGLPLMEDGRPDCNQLTPDMCEQSIQEFEELMASKESF
jgi:hypothetical protein